MLLRILGLSLILFLAVGAPARLQTKLHERIRSEDSPGSVVLDFADVPLAEVARTLSRAYGTSILTDDAGDVRVTFHLEGVSFFEGLTSLCASNGLDVVQEGRVYRIRRARVQSGTIALTDSGVVVDVKNMNVREFVREFGLYKATISVDSKDGLVKALLDLKSQFLTIGGPVLLEVQVKKGNRKNLGRPTTTPIQNKEDLMNFLDN